MFAQLRNRLILSSIVTVAIVLGLLAFILLIQLRFAERVQTINQLRDASETARELSLYTQYSAHDASIYTLGHLDHREEFKEHSAAFTNHLLEIEQSVAAGTLDEDELVQIERIRTTWAEYERAALALFAAADVNRAQPEAVNQMAADVALWDMDKFADQLDDQSQELARRVNEDVERLLPEIAASNQQIVISVVAVGSLLVALLLFVQGMAARTVGAPLRELLAGVQGFAAGNLGTRIAAHRRDEIGDLAGAFNGMAVRLQEQHQALETQNRELQQSLQKQQQLFSTVQQLSTPLLPIGHGVVVLPIIGHVDVARADAILQTLLHGVSRQRAYCAILDVTGIAAMDTQTLHLLLRMVEATELLGAQVLMAGITGVMAQVIVAQEVDTGRLRTYRDLGSAIQAAQSLRAQPS